MIVLLAVDGSDYSKRMLAYLAAHDDLLAKGAECVAVSVVASIPAHAAKFLAHGVLTDYYSEESAKVLAPVSEFARLHGWKLQSVQEHGPVAQCITSCADRLSCDLIVMGSHGHGYLANAVMGSVAYGVLARSNRPVMIIR